MVIRLATGDSGGRKGRSRERRLAQTSGQIHVIQAPFDRHGNDCPLVPVDDAARALVTSQGDELPAVLRPEQHWLANPATFEGINRRANQWPVRRVVGS